MLENFPDEAVKAAQHTVESMYGIFPGMGFVTSRVNFTQASYVMLSQINAYLEENPYGNIAIFSLRGELTSLPALTGVFGPLDIKSYREPLVSIDPYAWQIARSSYRSKQYYYAYDVTAFDMVDPSIVDDIKNNAKVIARNEDHANLLITRWGIQPIMKVIPNFEMQEFTKLIWGTNDDRK